MNFPTNTGEEQLTTSSDKRKDQSPVILERQQASKVGIIVTLVVGSLLYVLSSILLSAVAVDLNRPCYYSIYDPFSGYAACQTQIMPVIVKFHVLQLLQGVSIVSFFGVAVYWDAKRQWDDGAGTWAIGVALLLIIILPLYVILRLCGRIGPACPNCKKNVSKEDVKCRHCEVLLAKATEEETVAVNEAKLCSNCGRPLSHKSNFCEGCGTKL